MNKLPQISIISALYNAKAYLRPCIEGVLAQSYSGWELLLIDDGSTDGTTDICDEYAAKESRIRVFHELHQGVAHARQVGIDHARGKYTIHIDADDHIEPMMLEEMLREAENADADMLICDYTELNREGRLYHVQKPSALTKESVANDLVKGKLYGALWNKIIRTAVFRDNGVGFRQDLRMREDMFFILDVLPYVDCITYLPKAFYTYDRTNNTSSLTNTYLREDRNYYDQEIRWHETALKNTLVSDMQKSRLREGLLNYAYITLTGDIYTKEEWREVFAPFRQTFSLVSGSYKKLLVCWAQNGHYSSASALRRMLSYMGGRK